MMAEGDGDVAGDGELLWDLEKKEFLLDLDGVNLDLRDDEEDDELALLMASISSGLSPMEESLLEEDLSEGIV